MTDIKVVLLLWFINSLKKTAGVTIKNEIKQNEQLAKELQKTIIKNCKKGKCIYHLTIILGVLILQIYK